ncbi:oxygenase MpaB family protein, partial [Pseudomonas aeruginosa]|nr:oxygenase MpaB family protein [Pseudomonas aeruginosa]
PGSEQDRYYSEIALVAERLGARAVPRDRQQIAAYLEAMRPRLRCDERTREVVRILFNAPAPSTLARPFGALMLRAGAELLPEWAGSMLDLPFSPLQRRLIRGSVRRSVPLLRWAVRNASMHRACRRMGLPPVSH